MTTQVKGSVTQNIYDDFAGTGSNEGAELIGFTQGTTPRTVADKLKQHTNPIDFDADNTGSNDSKPAIQSALNTASDEVEVTAGTYQVSATPTMPTPPVNIDVSANVSYSGAIVSGNFNSVPGLGRAESNEYNMIHYSYKYAAPDFAFEDPGAVGSYPFGSFTQMWEMVPGASFKGNADAGYFGTIGNSGVGASIGAVNALTYLKSGFTGNGNVLELDLNNFAGAGKGLGIVLQGDGDYGCDTAVKVLRNAAGSQSADGSSGTYIPAWNVGYAIYNARTGLVIDQTQVESPVNAVYINPGPQAPLTNAAVYIKSPLSTYAFQVLNSGFLKDPASAKITSFATNIGSTGTANQDPTQYLESSQNIRLAGWVSSTSGTVSAGSTILTLDADYRPNRTVILPAYLNNGSLCWVQITSAGIMTISSDLVSGGGALDLSAVSFRKSN